MALSWLPRKSTIFARLARWQSRGMICVVRQLYMQICLNFKYMKLMHWIKLLLTVTCATPYKLAKCYSENPLLKRHRTIKNSSKGLSFRWHPILVVSTFSLLSNSELQNSSATSELILERMFSQFLPGFKKVKNTYQSGIIGNTSKKLTSTLDLK